MGTKEPRERTSFRMSKVRQTDTELERVVRSRLHSEGLRFRKNLKSLPGAPDIVFMRQRLAVFIDGDFWHGYDFPRLSERLSQYWIDKINRNIERDQENEIRLRNLGWHVLRVWGHEVKRDLDNVVLRIRAALGTGLMFKV